MLLEYAIGRERKKLVRRLALVKARADALDAKARAYEIKVDEIYREVGRLGVQRRALSAQLEDLNSGAFVMGVEVGE